VSNLGEMLRADPLPPSRHRRTWGRRLAALVTLIAVIAVIASAFVLLQRPQETADFAGEGQGTTVVVVERGDTLTEIGAKLRDAGVVATVDSFVSAAALDERSASIGPGRYTLRAQMSGEAAVSLMLDPSSRVESRLVLPEGLRLEQTVDAAVEATSLPRSDFQAVLRDPSDLGLPPWAKDRPEGFMFPASYDLAGDETAESVLGALVKRFNQAAADLDLVARARERGLDPYEVLVIASLIQAEGAPQDFAKVSRVIYNRLEKDMPLQLDATVAYALDIVDLTLSAEQLKTPSPYNTYVNRGLPPGPINSPGEAAIEAALEPAKGNWLYFVLVDPRSRETAFARTYERFLELKREYQANLAEYEREQAAAGE
jgi:UPF0755 protein